MSELLKSFRLVMAIGIFCIYAVLVLLFHDFLGAEASFRQPMAVVVIGGLITSTVLSLLVVPVVFTYVDDLPLWMRGRFFRSRETTLAAQELS